MTTASPIVTRSPLDLRPHPLNCQMPRWATDSQEWFAFLEDIQTHGIKTPVRITERNEVVDGETRRLAAKAINLSEIPCVIVPDSEVEETMMRELQFRRNLTKGQRAYLSVPLLDGFITCIRARKAANLLKGISPNVDSVDVRENIGNLEDFARTLGFSRDLYFQAQRLRDFFREDEDLRAQFEPKILCFEAPIGLGAALAGIAAVREAAAGAHGGGRPEDIKRQMELFVGTFTRDLKNRFTYWESWTPEIRTTAIREIAPALEVAPTDLLDQLQWKIMSERRRRNKDSKETSDE